MQSSRYGVPCRVQISGRKELRNGRSPQSYPSEYASAIWYLSPARCEVCMFLVMCMNLDQVFRCLDYLLGFILREYALAM